MNCVCESGLSQNELIDGSDNFQLYIYEHS